MVDSTGLTFVAVTFNSETVIGACLDSIRSLAPDSQCLVVDNASSDGTREVVAEFDTNVTAICLPNNEGFGRACNVGVAESKTRFVAVMNPDVRLRRFSSDVLRSFDAPERVGLLSPRLETSQAGGASCPGGTTVLLGRSVTWRRHLWRHLVGPLLPRSLPSRGLAIRSTDQAQWASGAFLIVDREEFLTLGGFDPGFFLYYEDMELGRRYSDAGFPIQAVDSMVIGHDPGTSTPRGGREDEFMLWAMLGWLEFVAKHDGPTAASRAARRLQIGYSGLAPILRALSHLTRWSRLERKAGQYDTVSRALARLGHGTAEAAGLPADDFYPRARVSLDHT